MLHIIFLILKIIGILILVLLGILVLLICSLLFTPLRYRVYAGCPGSLSKITIKGNFHFFFHLIRGKILYENEDLNWEVYAAWKKFGGNEEERQSTEDEFFSTEDEAEKHITEDQSRKSEEPQKAEEWRKTEEPHKAEEPQKVEESHKAEEPQKAEEPRKAERTRNPGKKQKSNLFQKIKYTFRKMCDKIKSLSEKKELAEAFVTDEAHKKPFSKGKQEIGKLLRRIKPGRVSGDIRFGFEDPAWTGYVLAGAAVIYPLFEDAILFQPEFEQKVLEGKLQAVGKIQLYVFVLFAWNMLWSKPVRQTIRDIWRVKDHVRSK